MLTKREIINEIERCAQKRKALLGETFTPYPESFKLALENESIKTLQSDLNCARKNVRDLLKKDI